MSVVTNTRKSNRGNDGKWDIARHYRSQIFFVCSTIEIPRTEDRGISMAERTGFEPAVPLLAHTLSKRAPSTTRPPLQLLLFYQKVSYFLPARFSLSCSTRNAESDGPESALHRCKLFVSCSTAFATAKTPGSSKHCCALILAGRFALHING